MKDSQLSILISMMFVATSFIANTKAGLFSAILSIVWFIIGVIFKIKEIKHGE